MQTMTCRAALLPFLLAVFLTPPGPALSQAPASRLSPNPEMPRPIEAYDSVFLEELTWLEVRDALRAGKTTVLVATGGIEQNGPYLALGKHNYVLRAVTEAVARKLGNALVAPIIAFVPEGDIYPPTGHMRYPGTISLAEDTFRRLLTDVASSLKTHGFRNIVLLGDSGGNQAGMKEVASALTGKWTGGAARIHYIPEFYNNAGLTRWLESQGIRQVDEGHHDDFGMTATMLVVDPNTVRMRQRLARGKFSINGVNLTPVSKTIQMGRRIIDYRATLTAEAIRKAAGEPAAPTPR